MSDDAPILRPVYTDGQLLTLDDFVREQTLHIALRELQTRLQYTPGVLTGMAVSNAPDVAGSAPGSAITVTPGVALDSGGRLVTLSDRAQFAGSGVAVAAAGCVLTLDDPRWYALDGPREWSLTVAFGEEPVPGSSTRVRPSPVLALVQAGTEQPADLVLAALTVTATGATKATLSLEIAVDVSTVVSATLERDRLPALPAAKLDGAIAVDQVPDVPIDRISGLQPALDALAARLTALESQPQPADGYAELRAALDALAARVAALEARPVPTATSLAVVAGADQTVALTDAGEARFVAVSVQASRDGTPVAGRQVVWTVTDVAPGMTVRIGPDGEPIITVVTGDDGVATLDGALASGAGGAFSLLASCDGVSVAAVMNVEPRSPEPEPAGAASIAAAEQGGSRGIELWRITGDGQLWTLYERSPGANWSEWEGPGFKDQPATMRRVAAAQQNDGNVLVAALDDNGGLWTVPQLSPGGDWGGWSGPKFGGQPGQFTDLAAAQQGGSRGIELWGISDDGQIWTLYQRSPGSDWSGWEGPGFKGQPATMRRVAAAQQNDGNVLVTALDDAGSLWTVSQLSPGGDWGGWSGPQFGGQPGPFTDIAAAQQGGSRGIELWGITGDGQIWTLYECSPGTDWSGWEGPGFKDQPATMRRVAAAQQNDGNVLVAALDDAGVLWTVSQQWPGGDWGPWSQPAQIVAAN